MALTEKQQVSLRKFLDLITRANDELADSFDTGRMSDSKSAVYDVMTAAETLELPDDLTTPLRTMAQAAWDGACGTGDVYSRAGNAIHAIGNLKRYVGAVETEVSANNGAYTERPMPVAPELPAKAIVVEPSKAPATPITPTAPTIPAAPTISDAPAPATATFPGRIFADKRSKPQSIGVSDFQKRLEELDAICVSLFREKDTDRLKEMILIAAKAITNADGGTLYSVVDQRELRFETLRNHSLNIAMGGSTGVKIPFYPIPLYDREGRPNLSVAEVFATLHEKSVNISDIYAEQGLDFSGPRSFDTKVGYRSKSLLVVPMRDPDNKIIGVLRLMNATSSQNNETVSFSPTDQCLVESLAAHAAAMLANRQHINQLQDLFESFATQLNVAIDGKSAYAAGHCMRVPELTMMLAEAVNATSVGPLKEFRLNDKELYELKLAGLLHDCGKVVTPVHVADKATKLQTVVDRMELINTRFEILKRDVEIDALRKRLAAAGQTNPSALPGIDSILSEQHKQLDEEREFLKGCNFGGDFMQPQHRERVKEIAQRRWDDGSPELRPLLTDDEVRNLTVSQGVRTEEEHAIVERHASMTMEMLNAMPWPEHLRHVPEIAGSHHERSDGTGFPRGLTSGRLSMPAKILCIADLFEELTAQDCPYRRGKTMREALAIMGRMKQDGRIDPDLFDIFLREKVYLRYAESFLDPEQAKGINVSSIPGYVP